MTRRFILIGLFCVVISSSSSQGQAISNKLDIKAPDVQTLMISGDFDKAIELLDISLSTETDAKSITDTNLLRLECMYSRGGSADEVMKQADAFLGKLNKSDKAYAKAAWLSGMAALEINDSKKARASLGEYLSLVPESNISEWRNARAAYCMTLYSMGMPNDFVDEGMVAWKQIKSPENRHESGLGAHLSFVLLNQGRNEEARAVALSVLNNKDNCFDVSNIDYALITLAERNAVLALENQSNKETFFYEVGKVLDFYEGKGVETGFLDDIRLRTASTYFSQSDFADARAMFDRSVRQTGHQIDNLGFQVMAAQCLVVLGKFDEFLNEAFPILEKHEQSDEIADLWLSCGVAYTHLGNHQQAYTCFEKYLNQAKNPPLAQRLSAMTGAYESLNAMKVYKLRFDETNNGGLFTLPSNSDEKLADLETKLENEFKSLRTAVLSEDIRERVEYLNLEFLVQSKRLNEAIALSKEFEKAATPKSKRWGACLLWRAVAEFQLGELDRARNDAEAVFNADIQGSVPGDHYPTSAAILLRMIASLQGDDTQKLYDEWIVKYAPKEMKGNLEYVPESFGIDVKALKK